MPKIYQMVQSSNIRALAFDQGIGYVEFLSGSRFGYKMERKMFKDMSENETSIGKYFSAHVKGKCDVVWRGACCDASPCRQDATVEALRQPGVMVEFKLCDDCAKDPKYAAVKLTPYKAPALK